MAFTTRKSLLAKVRAGDEVSWREFYDSYKPLILLCGKDCNLSADEKEELIQQVMAEVFQKDIVGKYDPEHIPEELKFTYNPAQGRFRHYLRQIIRNQALKILRKRRPCASGELMAENSMCAENGSWEELWNEEWKKHLLNQALAELRGKVQPETYAAFEMYALQERSVQEVSCFLNLSISSIYTAKSRCISVLKEIIKNLEEQ